MKLVKINMCIIGIRVYQKATSLADDSNVGCVEQKLYTAIHKLWPKLKA